MKENVEILNKKDYFDTRFVKSNEEMFLEDLKEIRDKILKIKIPEKWKVIQEKDKK